ncbi:MAG: type II secretion system protein [Alphaproteobacteria bacterium]
MTAAIKRKRGFTLTEIALVLSILGIVIGGIFYAASTANSRVLVNQASDELNQIMFNMRSYYSGRVTTFAALNASRALNSTASAGDFTYYTPLHRNAGIFPRELVIGTVVNNPWNLASAANTIQTSLAGSVGNPVRFAVSYSNLSTEVCTEMVAKNSLPGDSGLTSLTVTITSGVGPVITTFTGVQLPVSPTAAATACDGTSTATVDWYYNLVK